LAKSYPAPHPLQLVPGATYQAILHTSKGDVTVDLLAAEAPQTVNNFVALARDHFYDNITFHRVVSGFMVQTGDPTGTGAGSPGYRFADELPPVRPYDVGVVAMANAGPNTNGSQFFICSGASAKGLNQHPNYSVFGVVSAGHDTVQAIDHVAVRPGPSGERSHPIEDVVLQGVEIHETPPA